MASRLMVGRDNMRPGRWMVGRDNMRPSLTMESCNESGLFVKWVARYGECSEREGSTCWLVKG